MKKYMKHAAAFPEVPVPGDFLEKIHARIDAPLRSGILRTLFYPLKLKLPIEAAGALALTLVALFIFKPFEGYRLEYHAGQQALPGDAKERIGGPAEEAPDAVRIERLARDRAPGGRAPARAETDGIVVTNGAGIEKSARIEEKADVPAEMNVTLVLAVTEGSTSQAGGTSRAKNVTRSMDSAVEKKDTYLSESEQPSDYSRAAELPAKGPARIDVIVNMARALDGSVIRVGAGDAAGSRRIVVVEIPAGNYARFMAGINSAWRVSSQTPSSPPKQAGRLRLNMNLNE